MVFSFPISIFILCINLSQFCQNHWAKPFINNIIYPITNDTGMLICFTPIPIMQLVKHLKKVIIKSTNPLRHFPIYKFIKKLLEFIFRSTFVFIISSNFINKSYDTNFCNRANYYIRITNNGCIIKIPGTICIYNSRTNVY